MNTTLPWLETYEAGRLTALLVIPSVTAYTMVDLARQVQRSRGLPMILWLICGSLALALGVSCTTELAAGHVAGTYPMALPDHLPQAACAFAGCVWMLVTLGRKRLEAGWILASSLILALGCTALSDRALLLRTRQHAAALELSALTFVLAAAASYLFLKLGALAKEEEPSWGVRALAKTLCMGLLMAGLFVFSFQAAKAVTLTSAKDYLAGGLPLTALCFGTIAMLVIVLAATSVSKQNFLRSLEVQENLDEHRMRDALADQRITRLQNEALLLEIQERRKAEDRLRHAAFHDNATGLENRASITVRLTDMLALRRTERRTSRFAVILFHLDDMSTVNSLVGHSTVDKVLLEVAKRLQRFVTADHVLARVGDEKFLLLLKHVAAQDQALRKANLMLSSLEDSIVLDGSVVNLSASVGVCEVSPSHLRADDVLRDADLAVEVAKRDGGRQCKVFDTAMRDEALGLQQRKLELKAALEREELVLFYQPFVDMRDRSIYGLEALIRWNHPTRGLVGPGEFIPLSEETGQILAIGEWTLLNACRQFPMLQAQTQKPLLLSVNVSPRQLFETPFLNILRRVLQETSMPPTQLQLEVTESIFLKDASSVGALMMEIRSMGVKIAFDDFGTGYSSLSYLTRYPIDTLKVDQSFVRGMTQSEGGANLVMFMMGLAVEFNMSVTAEGVEEVEQEAALLKQGCCFAQGYLYSRPIPVEALVPVLQRGLNMVASGSGKVAAFGGPFLATSSSTIRLSKTY